MIKLYIPFRDIHSGDIIYWTQFRDKSLRKLYQKICGMLSLANKRSISAYDTTNDEIYPRITASLYCGMSLIRDKNGKIIYKA